MELVWNKYGISMEYRGIIIFEQNFDGVFGFFDNVYFFENFNFKSQKEDESSSEN